MTMEQQWRKREQRDFRRQLPKAILGAFAAALLGAGTFGVALWATNPPPQVMTYEVSEVVVESDNAVFAGLTAHTLPPT